MDDHRTWGTRPLVAGVVLLLLLLVIACTHTQQEPSLELMYSPSFSELESSPLSIPDQAIGYWHTSIVVGVEDFSTIQRGPAKGFRVGPVGTFPTEPDDRWIVGSSQGEQKYLQYYTTDPKVIKLKPRGVYKLTFSYRVLETPDEGFEVIFYSDSGANRNDWVDQSIFIREPAGVEGEASMIYHLKNYPDYQLLMNIVSKGSIAITDIVITNLGSGTIVAEETGLNTTAWHGPSVQMEGTYHVDTSTLPNAVYSAYLTGFARISSNPNHLVLPKDTIVLMQFDWKLHENRDANEYIGYIRLVNADNTSEDRAAVCLSGYQALEGRYVGGCKTGSADLPYRLEMDIPEGVQVEIANLQISFMQPVERMLDESPVQSLVNASYPRLGNIFTAFGEWVAHDGSGSVVSDKPLLPIGELERMLAYNDIVVDLHQIYSTNDPGFSMRMRELNPDIVLVPTVPTHHVGIDEWMPSQFTNKLATAEVGFIRGIDDRWFLRTVKGNILNEGDGFYEALLNVSPFCPTSRVGEQYRDYWVDVVMDLQVRDGLWEGVSLDQFKTRTHHSIPKAYSLTKIDADYNLNGKKDETLIWTHEMTASASLTMLRALRTRVGYHELILATPSFDYTIAPLVNGAVVPRFNLSWYLQNDPEKFSEAQWCWNVYTCWDIAKQYVAPVVTVLQAVPLFPDRIPPESKQVADEQDVKFQRFAIGSALLTDAFYEYDLVDSRSAPYFFDEMLVDSDGRSTQELTGKGWLGMPLGPAQEVVSNSTVKVEKSESLLLGNKRSKTKTLHRSKNTSSEARQYIVEFDWFIRETLSNVPVVNVSLNGEWRDYYDIPALLKGSSGHARFHTTVEPKSEVTYRLDVGKNGVVEIQNLQIIEADSGVFRRDFENGIVLVNATDEPQPISYQAIRGSIGRTEIRRIAGALDPETNNGMPVAGSMVLEAHDAIVLIAH